MRMQTLMAAIGLSVVGLWASAAGPRPVAPRATLVAPAPAAPVAPAASADFGEVLSSGGVPCHSPKRCCEWYPGSHTMCLNSAQCTAGPCP